MIATTSESQIDWMQRRITTAVDLTTLRDLETSLQEIVRHTRGLMATDMAYVSFTDFDSNETFIRKCDGVRTKAYASLRQPLGTGVLGRVAIGHAPYWTSDYLLDESIHRLDEIDTVVQQEGARALLGVPLSVVGRVIGALVVAERSPREFSRQDVQRLESLAAQAAIAIDNAMRHDQAITLIEELGGERRRSEAELALVTDGLELDRRLMDAIATGLGVQALVRLGAKALHADLWFSDFSARDSLIASSSEPHPDPDTVTHRTVLAAGQRIGRLIASRTLSSPEQDLLERVGVHVALGFMLQRAREDTELRYDSATVIELVSGAVSAEADVQRVLSDSGFIAGEQVCCVLIEKPEPLGSPVLRALHASANEPVIVALDGDHLCVVTADASWVERLPVLFRRHGWSLRAGIAWTHPGAPDIPAAHRRAELALSSMAVLGTAGISDGSSLGLLSALLHLANQGELPTELTEALDPLLEHDRQHGSGLIDTMRIYLDTDGNVARTSELLGVHRNTIRKRLRRIGQLIGDDWLATPRKLDIHLALRAFAAMQASSGK